MKKRNSQKAINFEVVVDGKPVEVVAKPYSAVHDLPRFRVSYNGGPVHIFGLDPQAGKIIALDSATAEIHPKIEHAIGGALAQKIAA